ncbi:MAG: transposase [Chloroflexi bacterium]|nr:transposase [Chloroflexota bacterium]
MVEGQLLVPAVWFSDAYATKRQACGVPEDLAFQTKPELGLALLQKTVARGTLLFQWVAADALYGDAFTFRDGVAALGKWYFTEIY